jgi:hypothetical protein
MLLAARVEVDAHDVAARVDPEGYGQNSAGEINRDKLAMLGSKKATPASLSNLHGAASQ